LGGQAPAMPDILRPFRLGAGLFRMLESKNGFYAFQQALHVFPLESGATGAMTLEAWNSPSLWRSAYPGHCKGLLFFAQDITGNQFCLSRRQGDVHHFAAETAELAPVADSLESWADLILADFRTQIGWELAIEWQASHGPLPPGQRLQPKIPLILGGELSLENMQSSDAVKAMQFNGGLVAQTKGLTKSMLEILRVGNSVRQ
jgi:hypothetical protein